MMVSKSMHAKLNEQVTAEFSAAHAYLAMACAFDRMGLKILAKRFLEQHDEECEHAMKIVKYVQEVGGVITLEAIPKPKSDYGSVREIVRAALESEQRVTGMINDLVALADADKDYATRSFLNWFVDEQVEEVSSMTDLLTLVELAGDNVLQVESRLRHEMTEGN
jgi:ferritin